jgi:hypothetical protein
MGVTIMQRVDICASHDHETQVLLQSALQSLGILPDDTWHDEPGFGTGVTRYRSGLQELTVYKDAWIVDLAGPAELVNRVLEVMSGRS